MTKSPRPLWLILLLLSAVVPLWAADARFDLVGPRIDVRVTRVLGGVPQTLPIASVPNLKAGDKLWLHPDLPATQSVKYLLICAFLRGTTNPPPEDWFFRVETWKKEVRDEGVSIQVPQGAEQAVLFMAPETGGDFATLKSAVRGRPGIFVRASQDLNEAGFEQARIERYIADIRRVPPADTADLQRRSDLLARTLALKPNADCFKRSVDQQFTCLTQTGTQTLLDDGHGQNIATSLSNGANSDFIQAASYTGIAGAGVYSAYVGAVVDLVRIMGNLHTAQYQYIPAIGFPQGEALNLRLNTPPSFHNPKSVLVIGLPSVQPPTSPPLRPANAEETACLLKPKVVLPVEGAPLVFSTDFATDLVLHLNTPPGAPAEADIPLAPDAYEGGLVLQQNVDRRVLLREARPLVAGAGAHTTTGAPPDGQETHEAQKAPVSLTGTIEGRWGFDTFTGPTVRLQQLPGSDWHVVSADGPGNDLIAGKSSRLLLESTGSACVHNVTAAVPNEADTLPLQFKSEARVDHPNLVSVDLPEGRLLPGNLHLEITQYGQPQPNAVAAQTFSDPPHLDVVALPASDRTMFITGTNLGGIQKITLGDLVFRPVPSAAKDSNDSAATDTVPPMRFALPAEAPAPPTRAGDKLNAQVTLFDGRHLPLSLTVLPARPSISLMSRNFDESPSNNLVLTSQSDLPLAAHLTFTLKSRNDFPRNGRIEVETVDGTLRTVLTLAPSGGLILQDPRTVVASLDPLRSFGPSAFGGLRLRAVFPAAAGKNHRAPAAQDTETRPAPQDGTAVAADVPPPPPEDPTRESDWQALGTLVRLPTLTHLQCSNEVATPCSLAGSNLFLIEAVSADPAFTNPSMVPDGFTGGTLPVPHPVGFGGTLFFKLRDDPNAINSATVVTSSTTNQASTLHTRTTGTHN